MSKYGVISGPLFPVFSPNTGKCGPEITPYLDIFHTMIISYIIDISVAVVSKQFKYKNTKYWYFHLKFDVQLKILIADSNHAEFKTCWFANLVSLPSLITSLYGKFGLDAENNSSYEFLVVCNEQTKTYHF